MRPTTKLTLFTCIAFILGACGAPLVGQWLMDAGQAVRDSGVAHAQSNCTWRVRRSGSAYDGELIVAAGWEPFAVDSVGAGGVLSRRCQ